MAHNEFIPFLSEIVEVIPHTGIEYTFRMSYKGDVKPGQFFEVSIPKYGEAPISVSGIGRDTVDLTIRRVGRVTGEVFERYAGDKLFLRGPYGNGFDLEQYKGKELVVIAGGTGVSPVRGVVDYFARHGDEIKGLTVAAGFKTPKDILFHADFERWKRSATVIVTVDADDANTGYPIGLVTSCIPHLEIKNIAEAAAIVAGPPAMMRFSVKALLERGLPEKNIWISYERKMCCGIGKCGHCKINNVYVCLNGPVFSYTDARKLVE
jgi:anaerobic sulfite reductase subunit B